ncbi:MAG: glycosyltransferase family 4 protein [Pseudomonadota bacterium]
MAQPGHILLLNVYFAPHSYGGATVVAEAVARELAAKGVRVTAVSTMQRPDMVPYSVMKVESLGIENYLINLPGGRRFAERYDNPNVAEITGSLIDDLAPDLVHAHCLQELGVGTLSAAKRRGLPLVLSVHDFWWLCEYQFMIRPNGRYCGQNPIRVENCAGCSDRMDRTRLRTAHLLDIARAADLVTFPSRFARDLCTASGFSEASSRVWANGIRPPRPDFFERQSKRRAADPRLAFGFLGGPSQIKGWPLIKTAFERVERTDFRGLLVDASLDGTWWNSIKIDTMKGDWQIHPRFSQDQIDAFYAKIDVLLFPSQWKETFGLTIREAVSRGIRVIQTDSGGTTEWDGAAHDRMLPIGSGPDRLRVEIERALATPADHPPPRPMPGYADQAHAFLDLVAPVIATAPAASRSSLPAL